MNPSFPPPFFFKVGTAVNFVSRNKTLLKLDFNSDDVMVTNLKCQNADSCRFDAEDAEILKK